MKDRASLLAVDGGNSKAELVLAASDGTLLAHRRGPTISHQAIGADEGLPPSHRAELGMRRLAVMAREAAAEAGLPANGPLAGVGVLCLAGADFASDIRLLQQALRGQALVDEAHILNDAFAPLRAGTERPYGVAIICGAGVNGAAIGADGRTARFAAVGDVSGDWGGGTAIGHAALTAAVRARDGRGPRTALEAVVAQHFGVARPQSVTRLLYDERVPMSRLRELAPAVFATAAEGDAEARAIIDRLADEVATMAIALARRVHLVRRAFDIVLAGGVFRTRDAAFYARIADRIGEALPRATIGRLEAPPVLGAAILALDRLPDAAPGAAARLRRSLER